MTDFDELLPDVMAGRRPDGRPAYYDRQGQPMTMRQWAGRFHDVEYKRVRLTYLDDGTEISTAWLGLDHQFGAGPPLIFETMVFLPGPDADGRRTAADECERYSTEAEAIAGHEAIVEKWSRPRD